VARDRDAAGHGIREDLDTAPPEALGTAQPEGLKGPFDRPLYRLEVVSVDHTLGEQAVG